MYSGGRFLFGIGAGWLKEETEIMGGDYQHRWTQTRDAVLAMKALWAGTGEYHGRYYNFPAVHSLPRPAQRPHPPVLLGGMASSVLKRVVAYGDGWMPNRVTPEGHQGGAGDPGHARRRARQRPRLDPDLDLRPDRRQGAFKGV